MPRSVERSQLMKFARVGAEARVAQLRAELASIYKAFPDLRRANGAAASANPPTTRRPWNAAQRKAAADRMRKYWASRKAGKK